MNQELCDPMEKEFSADWQRTMDCSIKVILTEAEANVLGICEQLDLKLASALTNAGADKDRLHSLRTANHRSYTTALRHAFVEMKTISVNGQRELSRSLLPKIQSKMTETYSAATNVQGGLGKFKRMDAAMQHTSRFVVDEMFSEATNDLIDAIGKLIDTLAHLIAALEAKLSKTMEAVYSMLWEDGARIVNETTKVTNPEQQKLVNSCRDALLPSFLKLDELAKKLLVMVGMSRDDMELEVVAVESLEDKLAKRLDEAKAKGNFIELCDSNDDDDNEEDDDEDDDSIPSASPFAKVKAEPRY
jgi:hypothetical protein